ncbi:Protein phosphatase methylesterase 1 [Vermiconidia calcicola]|uniref:Protein phosphatase methylesterase 1 n=1 Tax=Vermiconidia calcicola TaxID=1690605 RepID=A0ACC3N658_9PEZI|nr:Protein phosphatase methylesterase 1 [Vermiconidia calcicola]
MSDLFRQSVDSVPPRPKPNPISISEADEHPLSDSSSSSADSTASVNTVRPSSREQPASDSHWTNYFAQELFLEKDDESQSASYHVYLTAPLDPKKGPLFICHHGAGASGLSFAVFAQQIRRKLPEAGILSLEARAHGSRVTKPGSEEEILAFSIETLATDALAMINLTKEKMNWPSTPRSVLIGHSLGGAIVTDLAASFALGPSLIGFCVLDVVEGSALEALSHMKTYLSSRPSIFNSLDEAIAWHTRSRTIRSQESAQASVPSLLTQTPSGKYIWRTDLSATTPWWESWFTGMSQKFLKGRGAKMLMLAGTDRLDRELMIGQMQGKFQLVVLPEAGHFIQEDVPEKTAELLVEFFRRNDRSALVLPPKGKKV